jgi:hypothetical protein
VRAETPTSLCESNVGDSDRAGVQPKLCTTCTKGTCREAAIARTRIAQLEQFREEYTAFLRSAESWGTGTSDYLQSGGVMDHSALWRLASTTWYDRAKPFATYQLRSSIGIPALNAVHEFGDGQVETLGDNVERIQTRLLRSVFQGVKKCSV